MRRDGVRGEPLHSAVMDEVGDGSSTRRIAIGADHAGYDLKQHLVTMLLGQGHEVDDLGTQLHRERSTTPRSVRQSGEPCATAMQISGIVLGGSGQGEQLAANKVRGVRAALCNGLYTARMARSHNDANVLWIGARVVGEGLAEEIVDTFLATPFEGGRHARRVAQIADLEAQF